MSEIANIVATAASIGIKVECIVRILGEITAKQEHLNLLQGAKFEEEDRSVRSREGGGLSLYKGNDVEIVYKDYGIHTSIITKSMF